VGLIRKLKIEERNDHLIDQIAGLMEKFQAWLDQSESEFKTEKKYQIDPILLMKKLSIIKINTDQPCAI